MRQSDRLIHDLVETAAARAARRFDLRRAPRGEVERAIRGQVLHGLAVGFSDEDYDEAEAGDGLGGIGSSIKKRLKRVVRKVTLVTPFGLPIATTKATIRGARSLKRAVPRLVRLTPTGALLPPFAAPRMRPAAPAVTYDEGAVYDAPMYEEAPAEAVYDEPEFIEAEGEALPEDEFYEYDEAPPEQGDGLGFWAAVATAVGQGAKALKKHKDKKDAKKAVKAQRQHELALKSAESQAIIAAQQAEAKKFQRNVVLAGAGIVGLGAVAFIATRQRSRR